MPKFKHIEGKNNTIFTYIISMLNLLVILWIIG